MTIEAIIFDFDGIIIDTESPDLEVWQDCYRAHGLDLTLDVWAKRVGHNEDDSFDPVAHFEKITGQPFDPALRQANVQRYLDRCASQPILPGVTALLQAARDHGIPLAIASSSYRKWVERWLRHHNLWHYFACIRTRDDVAKGKPAPDLYLSAAACLGVPVERCIAIEDSPIGMQAALSAGIRCIAVPNPLTARLPLPNVNLRLQSLADIDLQGLLAQF